MPRDRLHDTTGADLGAVEHPAPNVEPGDVVMLDDGVGGPAVGVQVERFDATPPP